MNRPPRRRLLTLAGFLIPGLLAAAPDAGLAQSPEPTDAPFLWMIEGETPSFLYGTVHIPDARVTAIPEVVDAALRRSDFVYTELPSDLNAKMAVAQAFMLPKGESLSKILSRDLYARADAYLQTKGYSMIFFDGMKVYALFAVIALADYLQELATNPPLDDVIAQRAQAAGATAMALETVEEQVAAFEAMSVREQIEILEETIDHLEETAKDDVSPPEKLVRAYLAGDAEYLVEIMYEYMDTNQRTVKKLLQVLLHDRNALMSERIQSALEDSPDKVHFFAVGALHYPGKTGILAEMRAAGYEIHRLGAADLTKLEDRIGAAMGAGR